MTVQMIHSPWIGEIEWDEQCEIHFPHGLPGFENERRFLPVEIPAQRPLVYLQSVENHAVCFLCLPVLTIDPAFALELSEDDHAMLRLEDGLEPELGRDVLCLGLLAPLGRTVETDLRTPIVIQPGTVVWGCRRWEWKRPAVSAGAKPASGSPCARDPAAHRRGDSDRPRCRNRSHGDLANAGQAGRQRAARGGGDAEKARTVAVANRRAAGFAGGAGEVLRLFGAAGGNEEPGGNQEEAPQNRPKESRDSADKD